MDSHDRLVRTSQAGEYAWMTYKDVYDAVMKLAASVSKSAVKQVNKTRPFPSLFSSRAVLHMEVVL
jgi:hypothetical protein